MATRHRPEDGRWVKSGVITLDKKGATRCTYQPVLFDGSGDHFNVY